MISVTPIFVPQIDWSNFLREAVNATGRSPAATMNDNGERVEGPGALLKAIRQFSGRVDVRHINMGFLINMESSELYEILSQTELTVSYSTGDTIVAIVSGNLKEWHYAFTKLCTPDSPSEVRRMFDIVYMFMEQADVTQFLGFRKKGLTDKTFYLE